MTNTRGSEEKNVYKIFAHYMEKNVIKKTNIVNMWRKKGKL